MKKWQVLLSAAVLAAGIGFGGIAQAAEIAEPAAASTVGAEVSNSVKGKIWGSHVVELPVITEIDYAEGLAADDALLGRYVGCSLIGKVLDNADMIVGRSMDFYFSNRPAYILRTAVPGYYKTVGLAYNALAGPTFEEVEKNGISEKDISGMIFFTTDIMNEKGLYVEANMRPEEPEEETGIKPSSGTNPGAEYRMSFIALIRFLGERAANVDEAVALAKTVDVHGMKTEHSEWGGALFLADPSGHHGLLELVDNKLVWTDGAVGHTNFYYSDGYRDKAKYGNGYGRFDVLVKGLDAVKTERDMMDLIYKVRYTQLIRPETCAFNPLTEFTGIESPAFEKFGGKLTAKVAMDPANYDELMKTAMAAFADKRDWTLQQLRDDGTLWQSQFQVVANCNKKNLHVMCFEDPNLVFDFTVEK